MLPARGFPETRQAQSGIQLYRGREAPARILNPLRGAFTPCDVRDTIATVKRLVLAALAPLLLAGCVERFINLRSEPAGADVYLDGDKVGQTPIDIPYIWYGTREVILEKRGYREIREHVALNPPWWQYPGIDFITDVVLPFTITDRMEYSFNLEPAPLTKDEIDGTLKRAEETKPKADR